MDILADLDSMKLAIKRADFQKFTAYVLRSKTFKLLIQKNLGGN